MKKISRPEILQPTWNRKGVHRGVINSNNGHAIRKDLETNSFFLHSKIRPSLLLLIFQQENSPVLFLPLSSSSSSLFFPSTSFTSFFSNSFSAAEFLSLRLGSCFFYSPFPPILPLQQARERFLPLLSLLLAAFLSL